MDWSKSITLFILIFFICGSSQGKFSFFPLTFTRKQVIFSPGEANDWRRTSKEEAIRALSPLLDQSQHCTELRIREKFSDVGPVSPNSMQMHITHQYAETQTGFPLLLKQCCSCVVGIIGDAWTNETRYLGIVSKLFRMVPKHVILLSGNKRPTNDELEIQQRVMFWIEKQENVLHSIHKKFRMILK